MLFGSGTDPWSLSTNLSGRRIGLPTVGSVSLYYAALEVSTLLNCERLMSNVSDDMSFGLEHHVAALNWTFHFTVHDHFFRCHASNNLSIWRND
jgi:hypothetical protein